VVVDTLSQNMVGDSDNNPEMQAFLSVFRAFLKALSDEPVFGLLIHHPGHTEKTRGRGAYSMEADLDLVMRLEGSLDALTLTCNYMRDEEPFDPIALRLERRTVTVDGEPLRDARGREVRTLVVVPGAAAKQAAIRDEVEEAVLEALPKFPGVAGVQSQLVPKVISILGRNVDHKTVSAKLYTLERKGLAESGPGRQKGSLKWGRPKPPEPKPAEEM
jgi:hypothetical protein